MRSVKTAWSDIDALGKKYVNEVLDSGWLSRHKFIPQFEQQIAQLHGQSYGLMMNSGTDALRIGLATMKEIHQWPEGSEVIVPAVTFVATVNTVLQVGLKPVFVDVDRFTYNIDPARIPAALSPKTVALMPVHLMGLPAPMAKIMPIARKHKLQVLEDSCETVFCHKIQGDMAAFSFYMAHCIQTGVGGVLTTNNPQALKIATSYMNHGRSDNPDKYYFERRGFSSRATEMEAALGCAQLKRIDELLYNRRSNAAYLIAHLKKLPLQLPLQAETQDHSFMLFPMVLLKRSRDAFMRHMLKAGIETRQMMPLLSQPPYRHMSKPGQFPNAEWINQNGVCLPVHQKLLGPDLKHMISAVSEFFGVKAFFT